MPKMKTHKGLLKRIRMTRTGKARHKQAGCKHLRSTKTPKRLRRLRQETYMKASDAKRLSRLLGTKIRGREQPRSAVRRSPSPAERKAMREAARQQVAEAN
jgi:large subunit ribosomal protein L35